MPAGISEKTIKDYIVYLQERPNKKVKTKLLGERTIAGYINSLRVILYYFMKKGYVNPFSIEIPKANKKVRETYTESEIEQLLVKPDLKKCRFSEYRNWVIINYLLATANRKSTVRQLKIRDLNFEDDEITLRTVKNKRPYTIPMDKRLKKILIEYLNYRKGNPEEYVFCPESDSSKPLTKSGLASAISIYNTKREVSKKTCHIFRNYFAKHYLLKGGPQASLMKILGHKTLHMVLEYVDMCGEDLKVGFNDYNPLRDFAKSERVKMRK